MVRNLPRAHLLVAILLAIPVAHVGWMTIDWSLRDPGSPMAGGISAAATGLFQWATNGVLAMVVYQLTPASWPTWRRLLTTAVFTLIAFTIMLFGWLQYVIHQGIDTL